MEEIKEKGEGLYLNVYRDLLDKYEGCKDLNSKTDVIFDMTCLIFDYMNFHLLEDKPYQN